jgi:biopolymer transport protein ExbD
VKFRRQLRPATGIDITPLIDVVFLMLIFFMVSTTFTREAHLNLSLPEADAEPVVGDTLPLELVISADGKYAIGGQTVINSEVSAVMAALKQASGGDTQQVLLVTADAATPHEMVVRAMDAAGRLGFSQLSISTQLPEPQP